MEQDANSGAGMPHETAKAGGYPADSHLMPAEMTDPGLIRNVLAGLTPSAAIAAPPGMIPFTRKDVMAAGLDTLAVSRWLQARGGYGAVAYLRPPTHKLAAGTCRPALHPVSYFAVPEDAIKAPTAAAVDADAQSGTAAA